MSSLERQVLQIDDKVLPANHPAKNEINRLGVNGTKDQSCENCSF